MHHAPQRRHPDDGLRLKPTIDRLCELEHENYGTKGGATAKKKVLVLDNAKYHHARDKDGNDGWIDLKTLPKMRSYEYMEEFGIESFKGTAPSGKEREFVVSQLLNEEGKVPSARGKGEEGGPMPDMMRDALRDWLLKNRPERIQCRLMT